MFCPWDGLQEIRVPRRETTERQLFKTEFFRDQVRLPGMSVELATREVHLICLLLLPIEAAKTQKRSRRVTRLLITSVGRRLRLAMLRRLSRL